jgi:ABC-type Fe3+-siderophore transport system permease subunit
MLQTDEWSHAGASMQYYIEAPLFYVETNGVEIAAAEGLVVCASFLYSKQSHKMEICPPWNSFGAFCLPCSTLLKKKSLLKSGNSCNSKRNFVLIKFMYAFRVINLSGKKILLGLYKKFKKNSVIFIYVWKTIIDCWFQIQKFTEMYM